MREKVGDDENKVKPEFSRCESAMRYSTVEGGRRDTTSMNAASAQPPCTSVQGPQKVSKVHDDLHLSDLAINLVYGHGYSDGATNQEVRRLVYMVIERVFSRDSVLILGAYPDMVLA
jgi:hypothetical protein